MKLLKKLGILAVVVTMVLSFAACGDSEKTENSAEEPSATETAPEEKSTEAKEEAPAETKEEKKAETEPSAEKTAAEKYVEEKGEALETRVKKNSPDTECEVKAEGNNVVVIVKTAQCDGLTDIEKNQYQQLYEEVVKDTFRAELIPDESEFKGIAAVVYRLCDSKGGKVVELNFEIK